MTQREDAAVAPAALDDLVAWFERDAAEQEAPGNEEIDIRNAATLRGYIAAITELRQRVAAAEAKYEACKLQAQCHAQEARTANATIAEIYKAVTGSTGEPGNWNGAQPVIAALAERDHILQLASEHRDELDAKIAERDRRIAELEADAERYRWFKVHCKPAMGMLWREGESMPTDFDAAIDAARKGSP